MVCVIHVIREWRSFHVVFRGPLTDACSRDLRCLGWRLDIFGRILERLHRGVFIRVGKQEERELKGIWRW